MTRLQAAELMDAFDLYLDRREDRFAHNVRGELREYQRASLEAQLMREKVIDRLAEDEPTTPLPGRAG